MIYKEHLIEIWVNGNKLELEDQQSINMRFNNVLFDPTKITSTAAEYSFEFDVPATPKNNKVFDYANSLDKLNKFHQRFNAEVYADGMLVFSGTLVVNNYKGMKYEVNLVSVKNKSLEDVFGDSVMTDIEWKIPFSGASTINTVNASSDTDYYFPLVSYGVFQKKPVSEEYDIKEYTSKFDFDEYNRWYIEDFYPSPKMLSALRKAFETKGYNVGGDAFTSPILNEIYMSTNLADGQSPTYNLGNPLFGKVSLNTNWTSDGVGIVQDLQYPYYKIGGYVDMSHEDPMNVEPSFNFNAIQVYNMLDSGATVTTYGNSYMYQSEESCIVIPADGFYKITMDVISAKLNDTSTQITAAQYVREWDDDIGTLSLEANEKDISFYPYLYSTTPLEIALVRNYDNNYELIKGCNNLELVDGYPEHETQGGGGHSQRTNYNSFYTCFPHEKLGSLYWLHGVPTKPNDLCNGTDFYVKDCAYGYMQGKNEIMAYDPVVSPCFICGFTTMANRGAGGGTGWTDGTAAVMKNGYSWSKLSSTKNEAFYRQQGYYKCDGAIASTAVTRTRTSYNSNTYRNVPNGDGHFDGNGALQTGSLHCCVWLNKDDVLQLIGVHRDYNTTAGTQVSYSTTANVNLTIEAASPDTYNNLKAKGFGYTSPTEFDTLLNIGNFFNKEKKISEWIQSIMDAFNLEVVYNGDMVFINTAKKNNTDLISAVDIDDRTYSDNAESSMIEYPRSMAVKYKIDGEEWGFERSAVEAAGGDETVLDEKGWEKYADSGYTVIELNDDSYVTSKSEKNLQYSYTWYDTFHWYEVNSGFTKESEDAVDIRIPVISKFSYMIDGYDYAESMKHDGYGLAQRFWFRDYTTSNKYVWTWNATKEKIYLYGSKNILDDGNTQFSLSYKLNDGLVSNTLLTEYFNTNAYLSSNYVKLDVYLSPEEYNRIKNGSLVRFDSDLYYPVELSGYDPTGTNPTELTIMKKVN